MGIILVLSKPDLQNAHGDTINEGAVLVKLLFILEMLET